MVMECTHPLPEDVWEFHPFRPSHDADDTCVCGGGVTENVHLCNTCGQLVEVRASV